MRAWYTLLNDNPADVSVTTLRRFVNKRPVPGAISTDAAKMANTVHINSNTVSTIAVAAQNPKRGLLILQNNSTAVAPDTPPDMFFGFSNSPVVGFDLKLSPGQGLALDEDCPIDAIYVALGTFSNGGGTVAVAGIVKESNMRSDPALVALAQQVAALTAAVQQLVTGRAA